MPEYSFCEEFFPNIQSKPPLMQLEAISSHPIASYLGEATNTRLKVHLQQPFATDLEP